MKHRLLFLIVLSLAMCGPASAQIDPHPDGMSIYFDLGATQFCYELGPGYQPVTAYLMLTRPSTNQPAVLAWEARLEVDANPIVPLPVCWTYTHDGFGWDCGPDNIVGTTTPPLAFTGEATMLASITLSYIGIEVDPYAIFTIGRVTGSTTFPEGPGYTSEAGSPTPCQHIFGAWGTPCAWVNKDNCELVVANNVMTWGNVKALY